MTARQHQVERGLRTNQARRALRAARAGQQAERDFGQPELRARHREPVMRGERDFEAAAERRAVQRDHDRLRARFDPLAYIRQRRRRDRLAELADVGAAMSAAGADDQHRPDRVVGLRGVERVGARTSADSALTGGWSIVTTSTLSRRSRVTVPAGLAGKREFIVSPLTRRLVRRRRFVAHGHASGAGTPRPAKRDKIRPYAGHDLILD